jgi:hypothetical protein
VRVFGTSEIRLRDFIFFLPLSMLIKYRHVLLHHLKIFRRKQPVQFWIWILFHLTFVLGILVGFVRGNPLALILGDVRGVLFLLLGAATSVLITTRVNIALDPSILLKYCLFAVAALVLQMLVLRDEFVLFNFHQAVYSNFEDGIGRYILPIGGVVFVSLAALMFTDVLLFRRGFIIRLVGVIVLFITIVGTRSRILMILSLAITAFLFGSYFLSGRRKILRIIVALFSLYFLYFLLTFFGVVKKGDDRFLIAGRALPTADFFSDPKSYESELPETFERWDQHADAYDYIVGEGTFWLGGGAGVMYRTVTWDYLSSQVAKEYNYLTFSDGGFPYVLVKHGIIGLWISIIFFLAVLFDGLRSFRTPAGGGRESDLFISTLGICCILLFPFANPLYANDLGFFFGMVTTSTLTISLRNCTSISMNQWSGSVS